MSRAGTSLFDVAGAPPRPADPAADDVVVARGVSKSFHRPHEQVHTLKERALRPFRNRAGHRFDALNDVSFSVKRGEFFGVVGRNGSGKSTLLKCMAGIYGLDRGEISIGGRLSTFIELGVGFNPDLAARDNVVLNGIMLGLTPREARARFDSVIEFAELEDFVDLKLKNYSSGMHVRLAFSVMIQVDADVLLIDEVLAVGDASFQQKCFDVFHRLKDEGKTIVFVTHDMPAVQRFCDRALLLERGDVRLIGDPERVANHYIEVNFGRDRLADGAGQVAPAKGERFGSGEAEIVETWFEDEHGERVTTLRHGARCSVKVKVSFHKAKEILDVAVLLENELHQPLFATSSSDGGIHIEKSEPGTEWVYSVSFENQFAAGRIFASPWVNSRGVLLDRRPRLASAIVTSPRRTGGAVEIPHEMSYEKAAD